MGLILDGTAGISASGNITGGNVVVTNNFIPNNVNTAGNITGGNLITSGAVTATGNITGGNISVTNITGTLLTAAQTNITSVGTLSALTVTANVNSGNLRTTGLISATGVITTAGQFNGSGAGLTAIPAANLTGTLSVNTTGYAATVSTAAQPNITSVGTLNGVTVSGTATATTFSGSGASLTNIPGANVTGTLSVNTTGYAATVSTAAQPNITSVGTLSSLAVTANVQAGNILTGGLISATGTITGSHVGSGAGLTAIPAANVTGTLSVNTTGSAATLTTPRAINGVNFDGSAAITVTAAAGTLSGGTLAGGVTASSLTSVGTLTGLTVSGAIAPNTNGAINLGAVGAQFATIYGTTFSGVSTTAKYADLAENYQADAEYAPGTVLAFGGDKEVTISSSDLDVTVAGVVSTNPAYHMNSELQGEFVTALALTGRVPCRVTGTVTKGAMMVSNGDGTARAEANPKLGSVIGKALQSFDGELGTIEIVVGRL